MIVQVSEARRFSIPDARVVVHFGLTVIMAWFSVVIFQPETTMTYPVWSQFLALAPEQSWGYFFAFAALAGFIGLVTCDVWLNMICTFLLGCAHATIAICFYYGDRIAGFISPPGVGTYTVLAFLGYYLTVRRILVTLQIVEETVVVVDFSRLSRFR